jgi:hypothetical protein
MADDAADRLRAALSTASLPPAPPRLRGTIDGFPEQQSSRGAVSRRTWWLAGAVPLVVGLSVVLGSLFLGTSTPTATPSATPPSGAPTAAASGLIEFSSQGISFEYPADWTDYAPAVRPNYGTRVLTYLVDGDPGCSSPLPTSDALIPPCVAAAGTNPRTSVFKVTEYLNPGPMPDIRGDRVVVGGHPGRLQTDGASRAWVIEGEGGNLYTLESRTSGSDATWAKAIDALIASVGFSAAVEPPPAVLDGRFVFDSGFGLTFTYPMEWIVYYPQTRSTMDSPIVLVASKPLEPCTDDSCQFYTVPPGGIVVEFRAGNGPTAPDWSRATELISGQPAFRDDWTKPNAHDAAVGHSWRVRFGDTTLGIYSSVEGPDTSGLEAQVRELLATVTLDPSRLP